MECPVCGLHYVPDIAEDERAHAEIHDEWVNGMPFPSRMDDRIVGSVQGLDLVEAQPGDPRDYTDRFWQAALRARRGTDFPTPYDGDPGEAEWDGRAFVLRRGVRSVAFMVVRQRDAGARWWPWGDYRPGDQPPPPTDYALRRMVDFVWVLPDLQRQGVGAAFVAAVARHLEHPVDALGWTMPFTPAGERLVKRLTPGGFWATR